MAPSQTWLAPLALLFLAGCSSDPTALRLRLQADPKLNTEAQLLAQLDTLELVLDSSTGFAGASVAGGAGGFEARDVDGDGVLELVVSRAVRGALPRLQLEPGSNAGRGFALRARGLAAGAVVAVGGVAATGFEAGVTVEVAVPFNLRSHLRPLRVVSTTPAGASLQVPFSAVSVELSQAIDAASVKDGLSLLYAGTSGESAVVQEWKLSTRTVKEWGIDEQRGVAAAVLPPGCTPSPGTYRVVATSALRGASGRTLDQDASSAAADGFSASFVVAGVPGSTPCGGCLEAKECDPQGTGKYSCVKGQCVPVPPTTCNQGLPCAEKTVCRPTTGECVPDCRLQPLCTSPEICDSGTGLCAVDCKQACGEACAKGDQQLCDECMKKFNCKL